MPWPIPTAKDIAARIANSLEATITRIRPDLEAIAVSRAVRSVKGAWAQVTRPIALEMREVHDHVAFLARQLFPDTAEEEFILRWAGIWDVPQRPATKAIGRVLIEGIAGTALPAGIELASASATVYVTTSTGVIAPGGTVDVPAEAVSAGGQGNLEAGVRLVTVTPYPTIARVTVSTAFVGGAAEASVEELQSATLERIRQPPHGGAGFDYPTWVAEVVPAKAVSVIPEWIGRGSVGIVVALRNDDGSVRVPSDDERAIVLDHLGPHNTSGGVRPVTAYVVVVPAELRDLTISVRLRPDTAATRQAVTEAWQRFVATVGDDDDTLNSGPIGAVIEKSRISEAISSANGEYAHDLVLPAASFTLDRTEFPVAGDITWVPA